MFVFRKTMFVFRKTLMIAVILLISSKGRKINKFICKIIWNVTVTCCLSSVLTVQKMTSIWSTSICYLYLSTDKIFTQWLLKKLTNTSLSSLVTFDSWISWTFSWSNKSWFIPESKPNIRNKKILALPTNGSISMTKCKTQNFRCRTPFTVDCVVVIDSKQNTRNMSI